MTSKIHLFVTRHYGLLRILTSRDLRLAAAAVLLACFACGCNSFLRTARAPSAHLKPYGISYELQTTSKPRPIRYHIVRVDLHNPLIEIAAPVNRDPDGAGPAETILESPFDIAKMADALVFINANAFGSVDKQQAPEPAHWSIGMSVDILGLAVDNGVVRSPPTPDWATAFWIDHAGVPRFGIPEDLSAVRTGIAGFGWLVQYGRISAGVDSTLHPRTAIGLDASGRWLYLVVADGRQSGYSEGVTQHELAQYMADLGCYEAINLDGGGSSIMILRTDDGAYHGVNAPSMRVFGVSVSRPLPNGLVIKEYE